MSERREPGSPKASERSKTKPKGLLKEQLELVKLKLPDGRNRYTIRPIEETLSFDKGFYVFVRALQMLKSSNTGTVVVGVAGPSGSGKTAFSEKVKTLMPGVALISMDMYNDGTKVIDDNFDDPRLTDYELLLQNLADLRDGKEVEIPIYDFRSSRRVGYRHQPVPEARVVIVEGIYALSERLRPLMDLRVSITGGVHFDLVKRVMRDIQRSGQGPEEIIQQITDTVYPMYKAFIEPDLQTAHLRVVNSFNPFSGFMNATYILKSRNVPTLEQATQALESLGTVKQRREVDIYDIYLLPPNEDPETCQSWLRMRNRDGRYSLMFEEWVAEGPFIISPRISFEVGVRILGGLMALGYEIGTIMKRTSQVLSVGDDAEELQIKLDDVQGLGRFVQILGRDRERVAAVGKGLGLEGSYIPRSYIEQVQLERLTAEFQTVTEDWKKKFSTRSGDVVMPDSLSGLMSPSRTSRDGHDSGSRSIRSQSYHGGHTPLSSSAPTSNPTALLGHAGLPPLGRGGSNTPGSRAGGVPGGNGLLSQQLAAAAAALPHPAEGGGANGHSTPSRGGSGSLAVAALQERLDALGSSSSEQLGTLTAQLQAMVEQQREASQQLQQLASATSHLAMRLQAALAGEGGAGGGGAGELGGLGFGGGGSGPGYGYGTLVAGGIAVAMAALAGVVVGRALAGSR